jgi:transcriptional regulator with XRE-family HTH domain
MPRRGRSSGNAPGWVTNPPNRLRELREAAGLSHEQLAALVKPKTGRSQILKLEKGPRYGGVHMNIEWMYRLCDALGCHPSELLPDQPVGAFTIQERQMVDRYRELDAATQAAIDRLIRVSRSGESPETDRPAPRRAKGGR